MSTRHCLCIFKDFVDFILFITVLFRALLSLPVICYLMRYYYSSTGMGAVRNGNKTRLNLGLGTGMNHWEGEGME